MKNFEYLEPTTVAEACALLQEHRGAAKVFAGGAHLTILMKQGLYRPGVLINIKKIGALRGIRFEPAEGLVIGALVTHREIETSEIVREHFPVLAQAEREVANIRVRHMGTVGGNLASGEPLTDLSQIFIALDGRIRATGAKGNRELPVEELFVDFYETRLAADELLTHVIVPLLPPGSGVEYERFSSSSVVDKPAVGVAVRVTLDAERRACRTARIVLGCVGPTPMRARNAERLITGQPITETLAAEAAAMAAQEAQPIGDLRGSEEYKRAVVRTLMKRAALRAYEHAREAKNAERKD
ncbi:MAG TPA: xanthine dehydrogenase family protein subunit M [Candidatus Eisenbacteria bacterium]|nr:xanthine dehydrogenase family protein subunit M [Candidatus Eisenbacteria bacterium]